MTTCPVCSSSRISFIRAYRAHSSLFNSSNLFSCTNCNLTFASPCPTASQLDNYVSSYFINAHAGAPSTRKQLAFLESVAQIRIAHVSAYLSGIGLQPSSIFEVGPGQGFFAKQWLHMHPETRYDAYEVDCSCHDSLRSIGVNLVGANDSSPVDLVVLSHVLEHVSDPRKFLETHCARLKSGGAIFIEVPCDDWKHKSIDEPHLLFFNNKSLSELLFSLGFVNLVLSYHGRTLTDVLRPVSFRYVCDRINSIVIRAFPPYSRFPLFRHMPFSDHYQASASLPLRPHCESREPALWLRAVAKLERHH